MSNKIEKINYGMFYHIYNCGINGCKIFREQSNYYHFLNLYEKYIDTVADTFSWVLMGNHFHFLVRIKEKDEIGFYMSIESNNSSEENRFKVISKSDKDYHIGLKQPVPVRHFSHLFNAYARYFNKKYGRHGALFDRPFRRKSINNEFYLRNLVKYIHNNAVHHGYCDHPMEYAWSSYNTCLSPGKTKMNRELVLKWFAGKDNFKKDHESPMDYLRIENWLGLIF